MKNEKIKFKDRLKDISSGLGDSLKESTLWGSIFRPGSPFRKGYSDSPRNRSYVVMNNVLYHLHPVKVKRHGVRLSYTLCLGGLSFFTFIGIKVFFFNKSFEITCASPFGSAVKIILTLFKYFLLYFVIF